MAKTKEAARGGSPGEWRREFWKESALSILLRTAEALKSGKPISADDRDFVAWRLQRLANQEWEKIQKMPATEIHAQVARWIWRTRRTSTLTAAIKAAIEDDDRVNFEAVKRACTRLLEQRIRKK